MRLPNGENAIIDQRKITEYCLCPEHDDGKHKARLFAETVGISLDDAELLIEALRKAATEGEAVSGRSDQYGHRYLVDFELIGPTGTAIVRSAWIVRKSENAPRLVTCYIL